MTDFNGYNTADHMAPTPYYGEQGQGAAQLTPAGLYSRCSRDAHFFECKHESKCECGQTERLPLQLDEGL